MTEEIIIKKLQKEIKRYTKRMDYLLKNKFDLNEFKCIQGKLEVAWNYLQKLQTNLK